MSIAYNNYYPDVGAKLNHWKLFVIKLPNNKTCESIKTVGNHWSLMTKIK